MLLRTGRARCATGGGREERRRGELTSLDVRRAVVPFRLQELGYDQIGSKTGWLVASYAAGLIVSSPPIVRLLFFDAGVLLARLTPLFEQAYVGEKVKGRRMPLIIALLFMAGGELEELRGSAEEGADASPPSTHPVHGNQKLRGHGRQSNPAGIQRYWNLVVGTGARYGLGA